MTTDRDHQDEGDCVGIGEATRHSLQGLSADGLEPRQLRAVQRAL